ncbi:MAG: hypothetical protein WCP14_02265 [bacterium]
MNNALWDNLIAKLENSPEGVSIQIREDIRTDDLGNELVTKVEFVETTISENDLRIERHTRPIILDKKAHYNHTGGNRANLEYVLSPDETTSFLKVFRYIADADDWQEIDLKSGNFTL